jgi:hypothetical protein
MGNELLLLGRMSRPILGIAIAAIAFVFCPAASAQISMQRPGITGIPQGKKQVAAPTKSAPAQTSASLTADEQKRLSTVIKHMKPKDRRKLAKALQKMTPQQRQQLIASVKQQLAKERQSPQPAKRGW